MTDDRPSSSELVPRPLQVIAAWSWRILVVLLLVGVLVSGVVWLKLLFIALFVALLLTALLKPGADLLRRAGLPPALATGVTLVTTIAVLVAVTLLAGRSLVGQADELGSALSEGFQTLAGWVEDHFGISVDQIWEWVRSAWQGGGESAIGSGVFGAAASATEFLAGTGVALFATIFFLHDGSGIWGWFRSLFPASVRPHVDEVGRLSWLTLSGYARGTVLIAAIDAVGIGIGVALLGVPLAGPIAVLVFFGSFIPIVGALLSGLVAVLVALASNGLTTALLTLGVVLLVQQVEGHILQPLIQGRSVSIHPLAVVLAVTGGSIVAGLVGAVIAVPLVATANGIIRYAANAGRSALSTDPPEGADGGAPTPGARQV